MSAPSGLRSNGAARERASYLAWHLLNALLLAGLWAFTFWAYPRLPARIPAHIGTEGVTRWVASDSGMWFLLPLLATVHLVLIYALSRIADGGMAGLNVPHKARIMALPRASQQYVLEPVRAFMYGLGAWLLLLLGWVQWQIYRAALTGGADAGLAGGHGLVLAAFVVLPFLLVLRLNRAIRRRVHDVAR